MKKCKEKMDKKANKKLFYKTNPYGGISLIVLVITIIVVIILAAAVIISLQNNNPMVEANRARYESDVANMQMIFTNTVGKIMAEKQEVVGIRECQINQVTSGVKSTTGEVIYTINDEDVGKIIFTNENSEEANNYITGKKLPIYSGQTKWNVDKDGILRLSVGNKSYPSNESAGGDSSGSDPVTPGGDKSEEIRAGEIEVGEVPSKNSKLIQVNFSKPMKDNNYAISITPSEHPAYWSFANYTTYTKTVNGFIVEVYNSSSAATGLLKAYYIAIPYK